MRIRNPDLKQISCEERVPVPGKVEVGEGWAGPLAEGVGSAAVPGRLLVVGGAGRGQAAPPPVQ